MDVNYLLTDDEEFVVEASEQYGSRGMKQAQELIDGMSGLFAGGTLSEQDKDAVMKALPDIYWESKARNVETYTPKKYKTSHGEAAACCLCPFYCTCALIELYWKPVTPRG